MKPKIILMTILLLVALSFVSAQDITLEYVEGYLDLQKGSDWVELYMGDSILRNATVRLDQDSLAELSGMNMTFTLTRPGIYRIEDLVASRQNMNSSGLGSLVSGKVATMFGERASSPDTVGGVRASEAVEAPSIDWMTSEAADMISQARDMIEEGSFADAMDMLDEAYDFAADEYEEYEIAFYRGYIHTVNGKAGKALAAFTEITPTSDLSYYDDLYLLKGKLLIDSFAFGEAVAWFDKYTPGYGSGKDVSTRQSIYLLHGVAAKEEGLTSRANALLQKAIDLDPGSGIAGAASSLMSR